MNNLGLVFGHAQAALFPCLAPAMIPPRRHISRPEHPLDLLGRHPHGAAEPDMAQPALGDPGANRRLRQIQLGGGLLDGPRLAIGSHGHGSPH